MPKTSRPDRQKGKQGQSETNETTLAVDRVTRVVKGGRRMRFRATVVSGNGKGKVGIGVGKANDVRAAVQKAGEEAKKSMIRVPMVEGRTIPHEVEVKYKAARVRLLPASSGTGVIAGGAIRIVLEHAGIRDVLSKRLGTDNALVNAQATLQALQSFRGKPEEEGTEGTDGTEGADVKEDEKAEAEEEKEGEEDQPSPSSSDGLRSAGKDDKETPNPESRTPNP